MERHTRKRAFAMARARQGRTEGRDGLLELLQGEEIPHWKASATLSLDRWIGEPRVQETVAAQLEHPHPLVRQSAARVLEPVLQDGRLRSRVEKLLEDAARSVRVTAAWALRDSVDPGSAAGRDLEHMLRLNSDQPSGQMQLGQYHFARRDLPQAIRPVHRQRQPTRTRGEGPLAVISRQVTSAGKDHLGLGDGPTLDGDARTDAMGVGSRTPHPHRNPWRRGIVAIDNRRCPKAVEHHVQVPIPVQIRQRKAMGDFSGDKSPPNRRVPERSVPQILKSHIGDAQRRKPSQRLPQLRR
jgi:hypothetical protein